MMCNHDPLFSTTLTLPTQKNDEMSGKTITYWKQMLNPVVAS